MSSKIKTMKYSLGGILNIINERIKDIEDKNPPMDSVLAGILLGLVEARDLILEESSP